MKKQKETRPILPREEWPYEVPENWVWTRLGDVLKPVKDKTDTFNESLKYVGLENIGKDTGQIDFQSAGEIKSTKTIFKKGNILYGRLRPYLNKHGLVSFDGICSTDILVFNSKESSLNQFIDFYFHLPIFIEYAVANSKGINLPRVTESIVLNAKLPLPPLPEQQRIVARIELLFSKLDAAAKKIRAALDQFPIRKAAVLHKAFTGELTKKWREKYRVKNVWQTVPISDIGDIVTGSTPNTKHPEYYHGTIPFIKPAELNQGRNIVSSSETLTQTGASVSRPIRAGATCICCIGSIGKCGYLTVDGVTNQQINSIIPYKFIDNVYVYYYCCSTKFQNSLIQNSSATTLSIINKKRMSMLKITFPKNISEQEEIVRILDAVFEREQKTKEAAERLLENIDLTKKAILARAFRGKLGTNDPKEASAEGLLLSEGKEKIA